MCRKFILAFFRHESFAQSAQDKAAEHTIVTLAKSQAGLFKDEGEKPAEDEEPAVPNIVQVRLS